MLGLSKNKQVQPNRRRFERVVDETAMIVVNDVSYAVADWSIDGFRALGYRGGLDVGEEARGRLIVLYGGGPRGFNMDVQILRESEEAGEFAGRFLNIADILAERLERIYTKKLLRQANKSASLSPS